MANNFDKGMNDAYLGKEITEDPGLEYLRGYGYAESLYEQDQQQSDQVDDRTQPDHREPQRK